MTAISTDAQPGDAVVGLTETMHELGVAAPTRWDCPCEVDCTTMVLYGVGVTDGVNVLYMVCSAVPNDTGVMFHGLDANDDVDDMWRLAVAEGDDPTWIDWSAIVFQLFENGLRGLLFEQLTKLKAN